MQIDKNTIIITLQQSFGIILRNTYTREHNQYSSHVVLASIVLQIWLKKNNIFIILFVLRFSNVHILLFIFCLTINHCRKTWYSNPQLVTIPPNQFLSWNWYFLQHIFLEWCSVFHWTGNYQLSNKITFFGW